MFLPFNHCEQCYSEHWLTSVCLSLCFQFIQIQEFLSYTVIQFLAFWRMSKLFSIATAPFTFSPAIHKGSNFICSLTPVFFCSFDNSHPNVCDVSYPLLITFPFTAARGWMKIPFVLLYRANSLREQRRSIINLSTF